MQEPNMGMETDKIHTASNVKSPTGSTKKRKRRSIAGLAKVILPLFLFVKQSFFHIYIAMYKFLGWLYFGTQVFEKILI